MKTWILIFSFFLSLVSLTAQKSNNDPYPHLSDKELFKQEILKKEILTSQQNNWKKEYNDAGGNRSEGVMFSIIGMVLGFVGSPFILRNPNVFALGGVALISGIAIINSNNNTRTRIQNEFLDDYNQTHFGKVESLIELKTKGNGLALTYSF